MSKKICDCDVKTMCFSFEYFHKKNKHFHSPKKKFLKFENQKSVEMELSGADINFYLNFESLVISCCSLSLIPNDVFKFKYLTYLKITNNSLEKLPKEIGGLQNLRFLDLQDNKLNALPMSLQHIHQLSFLNISHNQFFEVPDVLYCGLRFIQILDLSFNNIQKFRNPPECVNKIVELYLSNNKLCEPPVWIFNSLCQLHILDISGNNLNLSSKCVVINYYNSEIFNTLHVFNIKNCNFTFETIQFLSYFKNLKVLFLGNLKNSTENEGQNYFGNFKMDVFKKFWNLRSLCMQNVKMSILPSDINCIKYIEILDLSENMLSWLPESFCDLIYLKIVYLECNELLFLPNNIGNLVNLQQIHLHNNKLCDLPDGFNKLCNLEFVDLYKNKLTFIDFCVFMDKNKLKGIDLEMNYIDFDAIYCNENIHDIKKQYNNLKNNFRIYFNFSDNRSNFQNIDKTGLNFHEENFDSNSNSSECSKSFCENESFSDCEDYTYIPKIQQNSIHNDDVNWDIAESCRFECDESFDPNCFYEPSSEFVSRKLDLQNNYCPANSHVGSITNVYKRNINLTSDFETVEGQFDSD